MTALSDYAKLEAEAVFHDALTGSTVEVVLSFGERSLIIMSLDDRALAHWPLVTLHSRDTPDSGTVRIAPDRSAEDYITLGDAEMISAIQQVCPNLYDAPPKDPTPRRSKLWWIGAALLILIFAAILATPHAIREITNDISTDQEMRLGKAMRPLIIEALQGDRARVWECTSPEGQQALVQLADRIAQDGDSPPDISLLDLPTVGTLALPGNDILIFHGMLDRAETPEALAGLLAHQIAHVDARAPLKHAVASFDLIDLVQFWWGAEPEEEVLEDATAAFLSQPYGQEMERAADADALSALATARLPSASFAGNLAAWKNPDNDPLSFLIRHPSPNRAETAKTADSIGDAAFRPALEDRSWLALANICDERAPFD